MTVKEKYTPTTHTLTRIRVVQIIISVAETMDVAVHAN